MKRLGGAMRIGSKPRRLTVIVMMLVIWTGVAGALFAGISADLNNRDYLKGRAQIIANALPSEQISKLQGKPSDTNTSAYQNIKQRLEQVRANNHDLRFIYLIGQQDGSVVFYVDSEIANSPDYSAPGDIYTEATPRLISAFHSLEPTIEGPTRDHWGVWMSAVAPVVDPQTNRVIALVGIDTPAYGYYLQILLYALVPLLLAAIPFAGLLRDLKLQSKEQEIMKLKQQFVSIASHELRSPLAGMLWAVQTLSTATSGHFTKEQKAILSDMYRSTESSLATVNEILDMSIFERGKADNLQREVMNITEVIQQTARTLQLGAQEKKVHVTPVGSWPEHVLTRGDAAALKRAFMNIVSNAIKYSPEHTTIEIAYEGTAREHIISIKDHGIGIPLSEQARVLEGYYRATNATLMQSHGTGLGLWVTKQIIEQHKGRLWLRSVENEGTTIYIALPIERSNLTTAAQAPPEAAASDHPA